MAVSKRLRFEILRRDNHQCWYCGAGGTVESPLTVDHVVPTTLGGSDEPSNLVAACGDCNGGKSSVPADAPLVDDVAADALRWARAIESAAETMASQDASRADSYAQIEAAWYSGRLPDDWVDTIDRFIDAGLPVAVILRMVRVAQNKRGAMGYRWAYFCGCCCWNRVRDLQEQAGEIVGGPTQPPVSSGPLWTPQVVDEYVEAVRERIEPDRGAEFTDDVLSCRSHGADCQDMVCRVEAAALALGRQVQIMESLAMLDELQRNGADG